MCWRTKYARYRLERKAGKDLTVYKIIKKDYRGRYCPFFITFSMDIWEGKEVTSNINKITVTDKKTVVCRIEEGLHSYRGKTIAEIYPYKIAISSNSYPTTRRYSAIAKCTIPKGSSYYINENGEVVSDHLIYKKITDIPIDIGCHIDGEPLTDIRFGSKIPICALFKELKQKEKQYGKK